MRGKHLSVIVPLLSILLLSSLLSSCDRADSTEAAQPGATEWATSAAFESPLSELTATSTSVEAQSSSEPSVFRSLLAEPAASPMAVELESPSVPSITATPDPSRTPVAIVSANTGSDPEIITIQNISSSDQDVSGWILFNLDSEDVFRFPENLVLEPGEVVRVYSAVAENKVPEGAFFWTEETVWEGLPANVLLLNRATRLVYWYVQYGDS
jgi:hypothetical protein